MSDESRGPRAVPGLPRGTFGRFQLQGELGRGGMGVVFRAWDPSTQRAVALKTLLGSAGADRFDREVEAMARLRHPNIVAIHETGTIQDRAYLVMDLIDGKPLDKRLEGLDRATGVRILKDVALAVHHAHEQGILHRDLKPSNILVGPSDRPYVLDFGIAKILDRSTKLTKSNAMLGTLAYMPPEQGAGMGDPVTPASDVYSLGATLYHVLTGLPPFDGDNRFSVLAKVLSEPPERPRRIDPSIGRDLEAVCLRCLAKKPAARYPSALELARDLERVLEGKPIARRGPRLRMLAPAALVPLAALLALRFVPPSERPQATPAPSGSVAARRPAAEKTPLALPATLREKLRRTKHLELEAVWGRKGWADVGPINGVAGFANGTRAITGSYRGLALWDMASGGLLKEERSLPCLALALAGDRHVLVSTGRALYRHALDDLSGERVLETAPDDGSNHLARRLAVAADGDRALAWCEDGLVRLISIREKRELARVPLVNPGPAPAVAISRDGTVGLAADGFEVLVLELASGAVKTTRRAVPGPDRSGRTPVVAAVALAPHGKRAATGQGDGTVAVWDLTRDAPPEMHEVAPPGGGVAFLFFAGGDRLLAGGRDGKLRLVDASGRVVKTHELRGGPTTAFLDADERLFVGGDDRRVREFDAERGELVPDKGHGASVDALAATPDGKRVLSASRDETLKVWDLAEGREVRTLVGHTADVRAAAISPDGTRVVSAAGGYEDDVSWGRNSHDPIVRAWDVATGDTVDRFESDPEPRAAAFSPDGREALIALAANDPGKSLVRWRLSEAHGVLDPGPELLAPPTTAAVATVPLGAGWRAVLGGDDADVRLLTLAPTPLVSVTLGGFGEGTAAFTTVSAVAVSGNGRRAAGGAGSGALRSWDLASEARSGARDEVQGHPGATVRGLALDREGTIAASAAEDGFVRLWALPGWRRLDVLDFTDAHERPRSVLFAGTSLLVGLSGGQILRYAVK